MTRPKSVDEYLSRQDPKQREILERVRGAIRRALPRAEETISYSIPAYRLHGEVVIYFAGWKEHVSLYPATGQVTEIFKDELAGYVVSKGTIRFPLSRPVPLRLVAGIARLRAEEAAARAAKATKVTKATKGRRPSAARKRARV